MDDGLVIDCFAGGGGASAGIEAALGRPVDIAVNHDPLAIAMHAANHPRTLHLTEDIFEVDLAQHVSGRRVALMWASPDCTHFSRAAGGKPREDGIRMLPWAVHKHAALVKPDVLIMENVPEIQDWGPLDGQGRPIGSRKGEEYRKWVSAMASLGYTFECRELTACDYGAPTSRKRWYAVLRKDGESAAWPDPTHGLRGTLEVESGLLEPYRQAAEVIDWSLPCPSVFATREEIKERYGLKAVRPLAEKTMRRIIRGLDRYVIRCSDPFLVLVDHARAAYLPINNGSAVGTHPGEPLSTITTGRQKLLAEAFLTEYYGNAADGVDARSPLRTVTTRDREGVTVAHLTKFYGGVVGQGCGEPMHTVTAGMGGHFGLVSAFASKFYGTGVGQVVEDPLHTATTSQGHFAVIECAMGSAGAAAMGRWPEIRDLLNRYCGYRLAEDEALRVEIGGAGYLVTDIGLRMLAPRELMLAQGFPASYVIDKYADGSPVTATQQVRMIGNSVAPPVAEALVRANCPRSVSAAA